MTWIYLALAIVTEVSSTMLLRAISSGRRVLIPAAIAGYILAFTFISLALACGMPLGVAYGIWVAVGVAATALLSAHIFGEPFNALMGLGVALIGAGVLLIDLGAAH